ncbi:MAG: hypothetical protein HQL90_16155 [Magnetococcales bacterium]|nr:hypothetical protein [Magnetococcales bacterium]
MKEKRTRKTDPITLGPPLFRQEVAINDRAQLQERLREVAQLRRHTIAIEADAYQSMFLICRAANRFLAPRRRRMRLLVKGLLAFRARLEGKTEPDNSRRVRDKSMRGKRQSGR